jgi:hypothetical protein
MPGACVLVLAVLTVVASVYAQPKAAVASGKLNQAVALLSQGKPQEARAVLATVDKTDASYRTAKCYDALCLYGLNDKQRFLKALKSPEIEQANIPPALREELEYEQIDSLFFYRKFEELLPKIAEFKAGHADSAQMNAVAEYEMAGLFERGMKNLRDAALTQGGKGTGDVASVAQRLRVGQDNLGQFIKLAADGRRDSYQTLADRNLHVEVVKALTALGGEEQALKLVAPAEREETTLAILQLHKKMEPLAADENLQRMTNFLNAFPKTKYRSRVLYDMADVALAEGWRLTLERKRTNAAPYLEKARGLFSGVVEDRQAGVSEADVQESQTELLRVFYAQKDWASLSIHAAQIITNFPPEGRAWLATKLYDAAGLANQKKLTEAASELDKLLSIGFKNNPSSDGILISAAAWRANLAREMGDEASARRVAQMVQSSHCYDSLKRTFLKEFQTLLVQPGSISK